MPSPVRPNTVRAFCGESSIQVEAQMDLLDIGQLIQPSDLTLGGCGAVGVDQSAQVLVFEAELQGCGSRLMMTEDSLIYAFELVYQPSPIGDTPIIRTNDAVVGIQCHYMRLHNVSSNALDPTWIPYRSTIAGEDLLVFTMRLMDDNWQRERLHNVFFLGDLINIEVSVVQANHIPLRVFVDNCLATLEPSKSSASSYAFIQDHGCLMDGRLTGSRSTFLPRVQDDKLYLQLDAFLFAGHPSSSIYLTCHLKATAASAATDTEYKACSFSTGGNRWVAAGGNDQVCGCCDSGCSTRKGRSAEAGQLEGDAVLSLYVQQPAPNDVVLESQEAADHGAAGVSPAVVVLAGVVAAVGLVGAIMLGTVLHRR
ncbi:hypothetical protein AGOR_G00057320 [Albula goreensis]|uniref:Zona pellucida sperm-binding protein 3 n=1 Tax=Albula goreensis TaxID=1534307 RepID=A0A8T3DUS2_9TELE|nr:hypothetical protein AGOR_G00057320 [Albula goreensis]